MRRPLTVLALTAGLVAAFTVPAHACTIDGKPSAIANDTRAVVYMGAPTAATYATWARFAFPHAVRAGQHIGLHPNYRTRADSHNPLDKSCSNSAGGR